MLSQWPLSFWPSNQYLIRIHFSPFVLHALPILSSFT
jgi:hypothetical protein